MSATTIAPAPQLNGNGVVRPDARREAEFLDKLLQIRDEVLAGTHAHIQLPPAVREKVAPRPPQKDTQPMPGRPTTNGTSKAGQQQRQSQPLQPLPPRPGSSAQYQPPPPQEYVPPPASASRPLPPKPSSSGIDPVLLTKSDHLIRAELQLKRQQIERAVKDQVDKKGRAGDALIEERETYFDVEDALAKAQALVNPVSGLQPIAPTREASSSFDENSYYSSKANSWSSEENESNQNAQKANAVDPLTSQTQAKPSAFEAQLIADKPTFQPRPAPTSIQPAVIDLDEEDYEPVDDIEEYEPEPAQVHGEEEEEDYSPPPAAAGPREPPKGPRRAAREGHGGLNGSRQQSPAGNPSPIQNPRKRRREEKRGDRRRQQANKRVVRSPEPFIKEEPQSPPPFGSYPESQPNKRRALQPIATDVEMVSVRDGRTHSGVYREQDHSPRSYRPFEEPLSSPIRIPVPQRRIERDDQDLRRVASLQHARRPYSPGAVEQYIPAEPRQIRAASHVFLDRPVEPVYREVSARPSAAPRYVRERSRSPVHEYVSRAQSPVMMAPPARRIVEDQFGNKYYAAHVDIRESVAPSRRIEPDQYYERAVSREPTMRAPVRAELYEEDDMMRMPPPPMRRYVQASEPEPVEARPYRQREVSHRPMGVEYAARGPVERRPVVQYEQMGSPREYVSSRAYSVRPEMVRREVQEEYAPVRHGSVAPRYVSVAAPRYREVSVVHQEPLDENRYTFAAPAPSRRYMEEGALERPGEVAQQPYNGGARRVSHRY